MNFSGAYNTTLFNNTTMSDNTTTFDNTTIFDNNTFDNTTIFDNATIFDNTTIFDNATMFDNTTTFDRTTRTPLSMQQLQELLERHLMTFPEYRLASSINTYGYITEIVIGSAANILALIVMVGLTNLPICNYMAALALADLSVILGPVLIRWLLTQNTDPRSSSTELCRFLNFQSYWSYSVSAWIIVAMTVDRYIAITYPLKAMRWSTPKHARITIAGVMLAMFIINCHFFFTMGVVTQEQTGLNMCLVYSQYQHFTEEVWPWIDGTNYSFLPFACLIIFNFLIIRNHRKSVKIYSSLRGSVKSDILASGNRVNRRLTITLLTVSFTFVALTAPRIILTIIRPTVFNFKPTPNRTDFDMLAKYTLTANLVNVLVIANHCINFFLYILTGRKFREQLVSILGYCHNYRKKQTQVVPANTCSTEMNSSKPSADDSKTPSVDTTLVTVPAITLPHTHL